MTDAFTDTSSGWRQRVARAGVCGLLVAIVSTGCIRPRAAAVPTAPPLDVPPPPVRVFAPPEELLPAAASVPDAPVPAVAPATPRPPAPRRAGGPPTEEPRVEPPAVVAAPDPSRDLRPAPSAADPQAERAVRDLLARSTRDLGRVNVARLSAGGRAQFEQARRFAQQAEQALGARNVIFAATLADKAASLAAELANR
jgi:hypothetical protein